tara:strand:+ start:120416 stop:120751 length:336 start_codon:yes stop_codon:yes gene_type:complete
MNFTVTNDNNYSIITSQVDKLNATNAPDLKAEILKQNRDSVNNLIIDLANTSYCDSSGLSAILSANRLCKDSSGKFVLCGLQPNVKKMIEIAQLDRVLLIVENVDAAIAEL